MTEIQKPTGVNVGVHNPGEIIYIKGNESTDGSYRVILNGAGTLVLFETRAAGVWASADISVSTALTEGQVPTADGEGILIYSGATRNPITDEWTFDQTINVPTGSINVGDIVRISEGNQDIIITNLVSKIMAFSVNANFLDATGSEKPDYLDYGEPILFINQPVFDTQLVSNPYFFNFTPVISPVTNFRLVSEFTMKSFAPMTNWNMRVTDVATGLVLRCFPSLAAWEGREPGYNVGVGDFTLHLTVEGTDTANDFFLGYEPFINFNGNTVELEIKADEINMLGNFGGALYSTTLGHDGPEKFLEVQPEYRKVTASEALDMGFNYILAEPAADMTLTLPAPMVTPRDTVTEQTIIKDINNDFVVTVDGFDLIPKIILSRTNDNLSYIQADNRNILTGLERDVVAAMCKPIGVANTIPGNTGADILLTGFSVNVLSYFGLVEADHANNRYLVPNIENTAEGDLYEISLNISCEWKTNSPIDFLAIVDGTARHELTMLFEMASPVGARASSGNTVFRTGLSANSVVEFYFNLKTGNTLSVFALYSTMRKIEGK